MKVDPERSDMIELRRIDGPTDNPHPPADDVVEVKRRKGAVWGEINKPPHPPDAMPGGIHILFCYSPLFCILDVISISLEKTSSGSSSLLA